MKIRKTVAAFLGAALAVVGIANAPQAMAGERNLVAFGDSVVADPNGLDYAGNRLQLGRDPSIDCAQSFNYAKRAGAKLGLPVRDFSCSGAVSMSRGPQIFRQVDRAIETGALSPDTARVIFSSGFNDTYNNANLSEADLRRRFVDATAPQIERIKQAAPNARIQIVGYPTIGQGASYCLLHLGPTPLDHTPIPQIQGFENKAQWMQVDLAARTGVEFLDLKPATADNGMCAPADRRMWAGLVDFSGGAGNLPVHINVRGHEHVANVIAGS